MEHKRTALIAAAFVLAAFLVWWWTRSAPTAIAPTVSAVPEPVADTPEPVAPVAQATVAKKRSAVRLRTPAQTPPTPLQQRDAPSEWAQLILRAVDDASGEQVNNVHAGWLVVGGEQRDIHGDLMGAFRLAAERRDTPPMPAPNADGTTTLVVRPDKPFTLFVWAPGYAPETIAVPPLAENETRELIVRLDPGYVLNVRVGNAAGDPIPDAVIDLTPAKAAGDQYVRVDNEINHIATVRFATLGRTDETGEITARLNSKSDFFLHANHPDYIDAVRHVNAPRGQTVRLEFVLDKPGIITGRVTASGAVPLADLGVEVQPVDRFGDPKRSTTNDDGKFAIGDLEAGEYEVRTQWAVGRPYRNVKRNALVALNATTDVQLDFPENSATITGRLSLDGQRPVWGSGSAVVETSSGTEKFGFDVDPDGYFEGAIPPGDALFSIRGKFDPAAPHRVHIFSAHISPGETLRYNIEFPPVDLHTVAGTVSGLGENEQAVVHALPGEWPLFNSFADVVALNGEFFLMAWAELKADGEFALHGLEPGDYTVLVFTHPIEPSENVVLEESMRFQQQRVAVDENTPPIHFQF